MGVGGACGGRARGGRGVAATGYGWARYRDLEEGIRRSDALAALAAPPTPTLPSATGPNALGLATQNLLVIGLDSRLDENGDPLPPGGLPGDGHRRAGCRWL